jgi:hypothetical protein
MNWLSPDWRVCFEARVTGRPYIQSWGAYLGPAGDGADDHHLFRFWQQTDPKRIGVNAPRMRQVAGDRIAALRDARRRVSARMIDRLANWIAQAAI